MRPVIFMSAETGFIIRNTLLGEFGNSIVLDHDLVVAVQRPTEEMLLSQISGKSVQLVRYLTAKSLGQPQMRQWLHFWIDRVVSLEKQNPTILMRMDRLKRKKSARGRVLDTTLSALSRCVISLGLQRELERRYINEIRRWEVTERWRDLLRDLAPDHILSNSLSLTNGRFPSNDLPLLIAAHDLGIPSSTLIQSWDNLSSKSGIIPSWLHGYWVWSEYMKLELTNYYPNIPNNKIKVVGSPQFDYHLDRNMYEARDSFLGKVGLDKDRPYIVIGTSTPIRFPNEEHQISELCKQIRADLPQIQILLRLHPKDKGDRWQHALSELAESSVVIQRTNPTVSLDYGGVHSQSFYHDQINTLRHASAIINASSTLTVDAAILDRPIICMAYDKYFDTDYPNGRAYSFSNQSHYAPLIETGGIWVARSEAMLIEAIRTYLKNPGLHRDGRRKIVEIVAGGKVGEGGRCLADAIRSIES